MTQEAVRGRTKAECVELIDAEISELGSGVVARVKALCREGGLDWETYKPILEAALAERRGPPVVPADGVAPSPSTPVPELKRRKLDPLPPAEGDWLEQILAKAEAMKAAGAKAKPEPEPEPADEPETEDEPQPQTEPPTGTALVPAREVLPEPTFVPDEVGELNAKHAVISNVGGKCVVMEWVPSVITPGSKEISYQTFSAFRERYANRYVEFKSPLGGKHVIKEPLAPWWLGHEARRQYEGVDLVPGGGAVLKVGKGAVLNLWRGWGVPPEKGSWRLMRQHIEEVLAAGDQRFADYLVRWVAWKLQNAGSPCESAIVLRGGKGAGKGVFGLTLMQIFGPHGLQIFSSDHLTGKHNAHLQNKLFLFLDEAMWGGDRKSEAVLKGMITERWIMIEPKNINAFPWTNRLGVLMSANAKWVVPASHDERRYAVNNIDERWKQNKTYFKPLFEEVHGGGPAAMLYDLLQLDLGGWHPRNEIPQTMALVEQKMLSLSGAEQWWASVIGTGVHPRANANPPKAKVWNPRWVLATTLLRECQQYSARNQYLTETEFGRFLADMGCQRKSNGSKWGWIFPPLADARASWLARVNGSWDFEAPDLTSWVGDPE